MQSGKQKVVLRSWAFPHIFETLKEILEGFNYNEGELDDLASVRVWEALDMLGRDTRHLHLLVPTAKRLIEEAERYGCSSETCEQIKELHVASERLDELSVSCFGPNYRFLSDRRRFGQVLYLAARDIIGEAPQPDATPDEMHEAMTRQYKANMLVGNFFDWFDPDFKPELMQEVTFYERALGHLFLLQTAAGFRKFNFDPIELTEAGLRKYNVLDGNGNAVCYWCNSGPCQCGGRKGKIQGRHMTSRTPFERGLPEMDRFMWNVYGASRNAAFGALVGPCRALSEFGGEYGFMRLVMDAGGTVEQLDEKFGPLYLQGTRHDVKVREAIDSGKETLHDGTLFEAGDAFVSWPSLVCAAFMLNTTRAYRRGFEYMAERAGVEIFFPERDDKTVPAYPNNLDD